MPFTNLFIDFCPPNIKSNLLPIDICLWLQMITKKIGKDKKVYLSLEHSSTRLSCIKKVLRLEMCSKNLSYIKTTVVARRLWQTSNEKWERLERRKRGF